MKNIYLKDLTERGKQSSYKYKFDVVSINIYYHHHCQVGRLAHILLTLSPQSSLLSIAADRFSRLHPVSLRSGCMYLLDRPTLARPCDGVHWRTSLLISILLLQLCPICLVCLSWKCLEIGRWWPYNYYFVECCFQNLFNIARKILV